MTIYDILPRLDGVKRSGGQYIAKCPAHDDQQASLSIGEGEGGRILLNCHAGCDTASIVEALGLTLQDLFPEKKERPAPVPSKVEAEYFYLDENGAEAFKKVKLRQSDGKKSFYWLHKEGAEWKKGRGGLATPLYGSWLLKDASLVFLVEGEKDADTLGKWGLIAVSAPDGAGSKWREEYTAVLAGREVVIIQDNDKPGKEFAQSVARELKGQAKSVKVLDLTAIWPELPIHGDATDLIDEKGDEGLTRLMELALNGPEWTGTKGKTKDTKLKITRMAEVERKMGEYLLYPYFPRGKLTIVGGISGAGKTWFILSVASIISNGAEFITDHPFTPKREPGVVIYQTKENDYETDVRYRLDVLGATLENIVTIDDHDEDGNGAPLSLTDGRIEEAAELLRPAMIIFDPIQSFLGADVEMNKANVVRPILDRLIDLAKRHNCAVVLISHMSKSTMMGALDRLLGSSDFRNAARSIVVIGSDPEDKESRIAAHAKNSLGPPGESIRYHIDGEKGVVYDGFCDLGADDIVRQGQQQERKKPAVLLMETISMLENLLGANGFATWQQVLDLQKKNNISDGTLTSARKNLKIKSVAIGKPPNRKTWWLMPDVDEEKFKLEHTPPPEQTALKI